MMNTFKKMFESAEGSSEQDLMKLGKKLAKLTDINNHTEAYLAIANFLEETDYADDLKKIIAKRDREYGLDSKAYEKVREIYDALMTIGKNEYGKQWQKFVYSNT